MSVTGSSPLVRGQLGRSRRGFLFLRIIPARAGPTDSFGRVFLSFADHPRSCGANHLQRFRLLCALGSSPLVRGQRTGQSAFQRCVRIIPARAGPTVTQVDMDGVWPDHPRSCGANRCSGGSNARSTGSSPLVRGQLLDVVDAGFVGRIIPARAGPTLVTPQSVAMSADHPRSCGANAGTQNYHTSDGGSSPLVRGQHPLAVAIEDPARIIPARAGPTRRSAPAWRAPPDHPRSCGANGHAGRHGRRLAGSSPLVRGQRRRPRSPRIPARIIPARAGPTASLQ